MLSFMLRRTILRSAIFPTAQRLPMRAVLSNGCLALSAQRNFVTTTSNRDAVSTTASEPEPESKSKPKSTRRKTGSSTKASGKGKGRKATKRDTKEKVETKEKIVIRPEDWPPRSPPTPYTLWIMDWRREQPKIESLEAAQGMVKKGAQIWHTVSEYEKQRYQEKYKNLRADYNKRHEEWRAQVDPRVVREINRRRVAKGLKRIRGPHSGRPMSGFIRYFKHVRAEYPRTEEDYRAHFKAVAVRAGGQWRAMGDVEKAKYNDPAKAEFAAWREKRTAESQAKQ